jgi:hypothetical protein
MAAGLVASALGAVLLAAPAGAVPNTQCALKTPVQEVHSVSELPPELLQLLPPIADIGAPFNATDAVTDANLPFRRLIRAGSQGNTWFVWYEHGGLGYSWQVVVAHVTPGVTPTVLANAATIGDTLCAVTDGAFANRVPPYPPGASAVSGF